MDRKQITLAAGVGCVAVASCLVVVALLLALVIPLQLPGALGGSGQPPVSTAATQAPARVETPPASVQGSVGIASEALIALYQQLHPGVVSIQVHIQQGGTSGEAAGSGFILDDEGHILTNNHVVANATQVTVVFYDGIEAHARIIGTDANSDLAVIRVDKLPEGAHPLPLGDSDQVQVGEWVVAIGNPFALDSSMSVGIVSAVGRTIPSLTSFSIPQAIQTDAAINPGNSGGPLVDLKGQVIGVNAQIETGGTTRANAGVGFAIPSNIARHVVPSLIESGSYAWPWLGVEGGSVNLAIMQANGLDTQQGAYINSVVAGGPAAQAGLHGSTGTRQIDGLDVPMGGDVVVEVDGRPIPDFGSLLVDTAFRQPGDIIELTVLRNGQRLQLVVTLGARP